MKRIIINETYEIDVDDFNHTLIKNYTKNKKDGTTEQAKMTVGYFADLNGCLQKIVKLMMIDKIDGIITVEQLRDIILEIKSEIKTITDNLR
jgi:hypothetical protein